MRMNIKMENFCSLSTNPTWQAWLFHNANAIYNDLIAHLKTSKSCANNRDKMIAIFAQLTAEEPLRDKLYAFIREKFPYIIRSESELHQPRPESVRVSTIFPEYNPNLLTFPRRMILNTTDQQSLQAFLSDKGISEYVIHGGKTYIEYLPSGFPAHVAANIPSSNWYTKKYKMSH